MDDYCVGILSAYETIPCFRKEESQETVLNLIIGFSFFVFELLTVILVKMICNLKTSYVDGIFYTISIKQHRSAKCMQL